MPPPARHLPSILRHGLLCAKSRGRKRVVWACCPGRTPWACLHVLRRHDSLPQDIVVLEVRVRRAQLRRRGGAARGLWYSVRDIPPECIRAVLTFGELSRSPVEEPAPAA
jgi:hypothetical protein